MSKKLARFIIALTAFLVLSSWTVVYAGGTWVGGFASPLIAALGGTGVQSPTAHGIMVAEGASAMTPVVLGAGQIPIGTTSGDPSATTLTAGVGVSISSISGSVTITNTLTQPTVVAKTTNYSVLAADTSTYFTNTGAAGTVNFTLPTASSGLIYTFYVDAAQTVQVTAGASTTIQVGTTVSAAAGNITNNVTGGLVTLIAISSTKWVCVSGMGTWTVN